MALYISSKNPIIMAKPAANKKYANVLRSGAAIIKVIRAVIDSIKVIVMLFIPVNFS